MYSDKFSEIKKMAKESFQSIHAGLYTYLRSDPEFEKCLEKNYRLKHFRAGNDFYMTTNESIFHLIGYIDAIVMFAWMGIIKDIGELQAEDEACDYEPDEEDLALIAEYQRTHPYSNFELIMNCIASFESGEDW